MKGWVLMAMLLATPAAPAMGEPAFSSAIPLIGDDPLMKKVLAQPPTPITMVRTGNGYPVELEPLKPASGLMAAKDNAKPSTKTVKKPAEQLKAVDKHGWAKSN